MSTFTRNHKNSCHGSAVEEKNQTPHIWVNLQLEHVVSHFGREPLPENTKMTAIALQLKIETCNEKHSLAALECSCLVVEDFVFF